MYFDHSATTKTDERVLRTFMEVSTTYFANPASLHAAGKLAEKLLEKARLQVLSTLGLELTEGVFTSGGTEANNLAILGYVYANQQKGRHLITTVIEHPSVLRVFQFLETQNFTVDYLTVDCEGRISLDELKTLLRRDTLLVSIMHVNNEIGTIQPIAECANIIHSQSRAVFHSDCVQSFGKIHIGDAQNSPDLVTLSGHKIYGIKGSGFLAYRKKMRLQAISYGGGQERNLRNGTVSVPHAAALAKAARLQVEETDIQQFQQWRGELVRFFSDIEDCLVLASHTSAPYIVSVAFRHVTGEVVVNYLQERGIYVSTSSACSSKKNDVSHVIEAIRLPKDFEKGVIRISFGKDQTTDEIHRLKEAVNQFMQLLKRGIRK
ncbi:cysteine desulfurase family protein [Sporosarcina sp. GW1-11]|uniref:cysteine desulfurase family protein n=1 Tax=Sporosarcina sp. GW1-11 TaxID=2899126 RepID=UPI00294F4C8E|nr:cysteine desulfurase family protein [Sporosarcina sp. GW1-11]MDV6377530.1 cysteine desulfurase family protein [Sporosarcina sp. GW1-11]